MTQTPRDEIASALHALAESDGLRTLKEKLNAFNLFDAIGVANQERNHSEFLAFLLRPNEAHGLGDGFLKWFVGYALEHSPSPPVSPSVVAAWNLSDVRVEREWQFVDLFITSPQNNLAVVVENKIHTGEHSDQLSRYMETAKAHGHGGAGRVLLGVFLTRHGRKSSHKDYLPIGYEDVCAHLETLCKTGAFANAKSPDVETTIKHYTRMLRSKRIVSEPEITELCREIYKEHQAAFDRVSAEVNGDTRPVQKAITSSLRERISNTGDFEVSNPFFHQGISMSHFVPKSWADEKALEHNKHDERSRWFVYLQTETYNSGEVVIAGIIAPCEPTLRTRLLQTVQTASNIPLRDVAKGYTAFYLHTLRLPHHEPVAQDDDTLYEAWNEWVETEGPKFAALIQPGDFPG